MKPPEPAAIVQTADAKAELDAAFKAFEESGRKRLEAAVVIGGILTERKRQCGHGNWLKWLEMHFPQGRQRAADFIRVYENRGKCSRAATFEEALALVAGESRPEPPPPAPEPDEPEAGGEEPADETEPQQPARSHRPKPGESVTITAADEKREKDKRAPAPALKDALGNAVPECLADTFGDPMLAEAVARIDAAHKELASIEQHVVNTLAKKGAFWPYALYGECAQRLKDALNAVAVASANLAAGVPYCVCPKCKGAGCKDCRKSGAWPKHRHDGRTQYGEGAA